MEEERTNLVPRLQQNAYLHGLAASQPGSPRYGRSGTRPSKFPHPAGNHSVVNEYSNESYASSTESNNFAQELPAANISNTYVADSFDDPNALRYDANPSLSAQPQAFSTGALNLTSSRYVEDGYGGIPAALQYYSDQSNYNERPFNTDTASIGINNFATGPTTYTNGHVTANSPLSMPVSNNSVVPLDNGFAAEDPFALSPNVYTTGQAIANNPVYMPLSNYPIVPLDNGLMTEDHFPLSPNVYNTGQNSANYPYSMQGSMDPIVPMDIGFTTGAPIALPPNIYNTGRALTSNPLHMHGSNSAPIPIDIGPPIQQRPLCTQCNETFSRQSDLERHAKKHQPGPKEFKCNVQGCLYENHRKDKLREHVQRRHPGMGVA